MKKLIFVLTIFCFFVFTSTCFAANASVARDISAQNTFSESISTTIKTTYFPEGRLNISISGTWVGTITLQRSFDSGSTWMDVKDYTSNGEQYLTDTELDVVYRIGIKTGNYTSGTAKVRLSN